MIVLIAIVLMITIPILTIIARLIESIKHSIDYKRCTYYKMTKLPYYEMRCDAGKYGEYLIYRHLRIFESQGAKFLFNAYIPKDNGETSEIDVLMICAKGIFVFESKNYSGWIFGDETRKDWCQILPKGREKSHKEFFYNPIMQNRSHINHLKSFLNINLPMESVIVFSNECTLKSIQVKSNDVKVVKLYDVISLVSDAFSNTVTDSLSESDIADIYLKLYPCTQNESAIKTMHIDNIRSNLNIESANGILQVDEQETQITPINVGIEQVEE